MNMVLQKLRTNFFSSELHDLTVENFPLFFRVTVAFIYSKLNRLKFLFKRLATVMTVGSVMTSWPSFLDGSWVVVVGPCTVLFKVASLVVVILREVFLLWVRQFHATPSSTSWVWFCSACFIHCVRFRFSLMLIDILVLVVILKFLARIRLHFLAHELLFTFLCFFLDGVGSTVDTLSIIMLV